jgi:hypothetical protein
MEGRSVIPRTVMEEVWTIARAPAPLIDRQAKASERIDQFKADLADVLIKFKWTRAEIEKLILDLRLKLRAMTERDSASVAESNVIRRRWTGWAAAAASSKRRRVPRNIAGARSAPIIPAGVGRPARAR